MLTITYMYQGTGLLKGQGLSGFPVIGPLHPEVKNGSQDIGQEEGIKPQLYLIAPSELATVFNRI